MVVPNNVKDHVINFMGGLVGISRGGELTIVGIIS
jgi:hypothetical protein